jgi:hypothetical protein
MVSACHAKTWIAKKSFEILYPFNLYFVKQ